MNIFFKTRSPLLGVAYVLLLLLCDLDLSAMVKADEAFTPKHAKAVLDQHNEYRRQEFGADMYKMHWNMTLQERADHWARGCRVKHERNMDVGENLAFDTDHENDVYLRAMAAWHKEKELWSYSKEACSGTCHFTQIVWSYTTSVGCSAHLCPVIDVQGNMYNNALYLVCYYYPRGNLMGSFPYSRGAPCSKCAKGDTCDGQLCIPHGTHSDLVPDFVKALIPMRPLPPGRLFKQRAEFMALTRGFLSSPSHRSQNEVIYQKSHHSHSYNHRSHHDSRTVSHSNRTMDSQGRSTEHHSRERDRHSHSTELSRRTSWGSDRQVDNQQPSVQERKLTSGQTYERNIHEHSREVQRSTSHHHGRQTHLREPSAPESLTHLGPSRREDSRHRDTATSWGYNRRLDYIVPSASDRAKQLHERTEKSREQNRQTHSRDRSRWMASRQYGRQTDTRVPSTPELLTTTSTTTTTTTSRPREENRLNYWRIREQASPSYNRRVVSNSRSDRFTNGQSPTGDLSDRSPALERNLTTPEPSRARVVEKQERQRESIHHSVWARKLTSRLERPSARPVVDEESARYDHESYRRNREYRNSTVSTELRPSLRGLVSESIQEKHSIREKQNAIREKLTHETRDSAGSEKTRKESRADEREKRRSRKRLSRTMRRRLKQKLNPDYRRGRGVAGCVDRHPACHAWISRCGRTASVTLACPFTCGKCNRRRSRPERISSYNKYNVMKNPNGYHGGRHNGGETTTEPIRSRRQRNLGKLQELRSPRTSSYRGGRRNSRRRSSSNRNINGTCRDNPSHRTSCKYWAKKGLCTQNQLVRTLFCRYSCATCG